MHSAFVTRDGSRRMPRYLTATDGMTWMGCGRCFNVCSRAVLHRYSFDDAGEILGARDGEGDVAGELNRMIMVLDRCAAALAAQSAPSSARRTDRRPVAADPVAAWLDGTNQRRMAPMFARHYGWFIDRQRLRIELESGFDQHVLACVLSCALEELEAGEATATEATGLSRAELRDVLSGGFPAIPIGAFALEEVDEAEPDLEEELLCGLLLAHARPGDLASVRFAKIIARRAMRNDHLWQDLGLFNRAEVSRLLATHFPTLAAGNTKNMRWKKYFYRKLCEAEGFSLCTTPSCRECNDFESCFGPEEGESRLARIKNGIALD
ncbi:hypothetical protein ABID19_006892 [Mesorhizobium robiniae]|uniref:Nitrogen fixation protein NifQ n=2 Tax=Phyllobacteriaceae TaxID=69277 RepID=A0ABV2GZW8_9HYPH